MLETGRCSRRAKHQKGEYAPTGWQGPSGGMQRRAGGGPGSRAVCIDGPVGAIGQYAPTGPAGDAVERYTPSGKLIGEGGSRAVCAIKTARQSGSMHRQAGWGCRAVCSDGRLGHLSVGRYAPTGRVGLRLSGGMRRRAAGGCRRYAPSSLQRGVRRAGWGCRAVCTDEQARGNRAVCTDGPGGAVGRQYALTGRVGLSRGMHRRPGGGNQEVLTDGPGGAVE